MTWRLELSGQRPGMWNMDRDTELAHACAEGTVEPTLRLYGWLPAAVSLGVHQRSTDIDAHAALLHGYDIVRRPTGGRAILHADELTYAVVVPANERSMGEVYRWVNEALLLAMMKFGVKGDMEEKQPDLRTEYRDPRSAVCFSTTARCEVKVNGKKLIGSAQRRFRGSSGNEVVLQHGSILLGPGHEEIVEVLAGLTQEERIEARKALLRKSTTLRAELRRSVTMEETAEAVQWACAKSWGVTFQPVMSGETVLQEVTE